MKRFPKHNNNESNNYICYTTSTYFDDIDKQISEKTITYKRFKRNKTDELPKTKKKCKIRHKQAKPKNQVIPDKLKILEQKASRHKRYTENPGFSSTGVPLPTDEAKLEFAASKKRRRDNYYKKYSGENKPHRGSKFYINICTGGQNKKY